MNITAYNLDTVKATDVLAFMQSGDMGFETGKDYILYAGSVDGKSITDILADNKNFGYMNVAHTTLGSLAFNIWRYSRCNP